MTAKSVTRERPKGEEKGGAGGIQESVEVSKGREEEYVVGQKSLGVSEEKERRIFWDMHQKA